MVTDCEEPKTLSNWMIDKSIIIPCMMFEKYGSGLIKLMLGLGEPAKLIDEIALAESNE